MPLKGLLYALLGTALPIAKEHLTLTYITTFFFNNVKHFSNNVVLQFFICSSIESRP